jgi:hypothetical protein
MVGEKGNRCFFFLESADFSGEEYCIRDVLVTEEKFGIPFIDGRVFPRVQKLANNMRTSLSMFALQIWNLAQKCKKEFFTDGKNSKIKIIRNVKRDQGCIAWDAASSRLLSRAR